MLSLFSTSLNIFDDADRIVGTNDSDPVAERLCHKHKCHDGTNSAWYVTSSWNSFSFLSAPRECFSVCVHSVPLYPAHKGSSEDVSKEWLHSFDKVHSECHRHVQSMLPCCQFIFQMRLWSRKVKKRKKKSDQILIKVCRSSAAVEYAYIILGL